MKISELKKGDKAFMKNVGDITILSVAKLYIRVKADVMTMKIQFGCDAAPLKDLGIELRQLKVGQKVYFKGEGLPMEVKALSDRYAIVTREFDKKEDESLLESAVETSAYGTEDEAFEAYKDEIIYSILDFKENKKAPNDRVFNPYDYRDQDDINECLKDLEGGEVKLSRRNGITLQINWELTNKEA